MTRDDAPNLIVSAKERSEQLNYPLQEGELDGVLTELPRKLEGTLKFDGVDLDGLPSSKRLTLWFRHGAKRIFWIRMVRRSGRVLVDVSGMDRARVLHAIQICKSHFDSWFSISESEISAFERDRG